jgi:hypothetical protein
MQDQVNLLQCLQQVLWKLGKVLGMGIRDDAYFHTKTPDSVYSRPAYPGNG